MSKQLLLPELAESVVEGEILRWLVQEGEPVALEQPVCEVMTDKVTVELPSPYAGILEKQLAPEGAVVAVHAPIALISEAPEQSAEAGGGEETPPAAAPEPVPQAQEVAAPEEADTSLFKVAPHQEDLKVNGLRGSERTLPAGPMPVADPSPADPAPIGRVLAVPAARQLARELGLDIAQVRGSGPNGRVRPLDVHQHVSEQSARSTSGPAPTGILGVPPVAYRTPKGYEHLETRVPLRGMRRAISTQMQASHLYTVRTLTVDEANLTALVGLRHRLNAALEDSGQKLSYLPFIFKAVVAALKKHPSLNTSLDEATGEVVQKGYYHLGMAVTTDVGLTVPVIRDADRKGVVELGQEVGMLAGKARTNTLTPGELTGSSFSVTNIGSVGALFSFPIINVPDAAILGVHSIVKRPIVNAQDQIVAAHMMYLSLSFDHRLVDGAEAARFCKEVIRLLEAPELLLALG